MSEKFANKTAPRTPRFDGLPDLYSFYCCTCDEWHVEEGDPVAVPPSDRAVRPSSAAIRD